VSNPGRRNADISKYGCRSASSLGLILLIILVVFLLGGFSGRFGGYGYGYGHGGVGVIGIILIVVLVLMLLGRI
jgi:Na+/melibiose symporter-like transporter